MKPACTVFTNHHRLEQIEFLEDQVEYPKKWNKDTVYYYIETINIPLLLTKRQLLTAINLAMTTWDIEIPVRFRSTRNIKLADIIIAFEDANTNVYFSDRPSVLAYAYFPGTTLSGTIVFNSTYIWDTKGKGIKAKKALELGLIDNIENSNNTLKTYNILHVLIHELGHSLGLTHDITGVNDGRDVMDPFYKGDVLDLSDRDINRIRMKYGAREWRSISRYARIKRWLKRRIRR